MTGGDKWQWTRYETWRLWGTAWPVLLGLVGTLLIQLGTDVGTEGSATVGVLIAAAGKSLQQLITDNSGKQL